MANEKKGLRCQVCTGCGLCPGVVRNADTVKKLSVITDFQLPTGKQSDEKSNPNAYPVAIDIGTTTIAMLLYSPEGQVLDRYVTVNPQTEFGADVISRIQAAEQKANREKLQALAEDEICKGFARFRKKLPAEGRLLPVMAANTTETYLTFGWNPEELGRAPFTVSQKYGGVGELAGEQVFVFPGMSAFVGGDIAAGVYALNLVNCKELTLLVDLGTNGEIVLGNADRCIACATAAGPAFEGGANKGIWGADMVSLLATLRREGILDETGLLCDPYFETGVTVGNVKVTKEAVRSVQVAKGAIAAGIEILMAHLGVTAGAIDRVVLAGGFGYYLNPEDAALIGLIPSKLKGKAVAGGNTSLAGCTLLGRQRGICKDAELEEKLQEMTEKIECINLAAEEAFHEIFMDCLALRERA